MKRNWISRQEAEKMLPKDQIGITTELKMGPALEHLQDSYDELHSPHYLENQMDEFDSEDYIEEEMRKFVMGFQYKPREYPYNYFRKRLRKMDGKISIIADNHEEQHIADQLSLIVNAYLKEERKDG